MRIYTYYQLVDDWRFSERNNYAFQNELIDLWKISWSRQGYEPIVLNLEDAKKHPYYETLNSEMRRIFREITNREIEEFGMSCWFRWLAYATQTEEKFYVSDYDAINVNFPITEPNDKLHLMDGDCPFLASGTPKQFENLCKAFVEVSNERLEILKNQANHYHDQEFFYYNISELNHGCIKLRNDLTLLFGDREQYRQKIGGFYDYINKQCVTGIKTIKVDNPFNYGVYHLSHYSCKIQYENNPKLIEQFNSQEQFRIEIAKQLLGI
jgi:hypothetical protein